MARGRRWRIRFGVGGIGLVLALSSLACDSPGGLFINVLTDLRADVEFDAIRVQLLETPRDTRRRTFVLEDFQADGTSNPLMAGHRVVDLTAPVAGDYRVRVSLTRGGAIVQEQSFVRTYTRPTIWVLPITRDCNDLVCPEQRCERGACVDVTCADGDDAPICSSSGEVPPCLSDEECGSTAQGGCLTPLCSRGVCLTIANDALCGEQVCDPETDACVASTELFDPAPGEMVDAGPRCSPASCDDGDACTVDRCEDGLCRNDALCADDAYCELGECFREPSFALETVEPGGCVDLGVDHNSATDFAFRRITSGEPNAAVTQVNEHLSCGRGPEDAESYVLDASGNDEYTFRTAAVSDCFFPVYGRWRSRARVDGRFSAPDETIYYNSRCPGVQTCAIASTFCSPCESCSAEEYCVGADGCAPRPTLRIDTPSGPGCVDLGVPHADPPALHVIITGRPRATSTQINRQVSCGTPEEPAEVRMLDDEGRAEQRLETGAAPCDLTVYGRWIIRVDVDGQASNDVDIVYYNSTCPGITTCSMARAHCGA